MSNSPPVYERFDIPQELDKFNSKGKNILPKLYSTKIKVNSNEQENQFVISWTPSVLKSSHHGQLTLNFKYERKNNLGNK